VLTKAAVSVTGAIQYPTWKVNLIVMVIYPGKFIIMVVVLKVIPPGSGSDPTTGTVKQTERQFEGVDAFRQIIGHGLPLMIPGNY